MREIARASERKKRVREREREREAGEGKVGHERAAASVQVVGQPFPCAGLALTTLFHAAHALPHHYKGYYTLLHVPATVGYTLNIC